MNWSEAAAIPLAGLTAYQALNQAQIRPQQKILILGGSSATGIFAIQYAKRVIGVSQIVCTCSAGNAELCRKLGVDQTIDYNTAKWWEVLKGQNFDIIYDCVGGFESWVNSSLVLKKSGSFVTPVGDGGAHKLTVGALLKLGGSIINRKFWNFVGSSPRYGLIMLDNKRGDQLEIVRGYIEAGQIKAIVEKEYNFDDFVEMFKHSMNGRAKGKLTLRIPHEAN